VVTTDELADWFRGFAPERTDRRPSASTIAE